MVKQIKIEQPFLNFRGRLSEGVTYNPANNTLLWVDIIAGEVHRVKLLEGDDYTPEQLTTVAATHEVVKVPDSVGVIGLTKDKDVYIAGCQFGYGFVSFVTGEFVYRKRYANALATLRSNDGTVDPQGNFWVGTMSDFSVGSVKPEGSLYRINTNGSIDEVFSECLIPNGMAFSGSTLTWIDSLTFTIWKFDYNLETGEVSNKRPHIEIKKVLPDLNSPEPDGMTMLPDGSIYVAVWSSSRVLHFDPEGKLVTEFVFPAERISCVTFGGTSGDEMFVTTANQHLDDVTRLDEVEDFGGSIFRVKVPGVKSTPKSIWQGSLE
ncbi:hypothetical protein BABINDRAFT_10024 [Babjeviella inositovora NRRL Y-12698]|uniref:SMP-30/Gluconolactonase/LRE-like region domain-containing protein n=1 Tax=Babjeviella inositovora NRRL Y-12698 TaxID=984486 RepID=A0A1E3QL25_9ASCO|nr:uncharacterized protein BABINDRAFT_10024 [Babjeviella inositovora NRRL Y-12698]ODQ77697.1 hypothetical protein BABINDRAFT_10024 [Babjeviella inositovora NRRL Y-12698]